MEILDTLLKYGYIILFFYSLGGGFFALVGAAILSYAGKMDISLTIIVASSSNFIGDIMLFILARYNKPMIQTYIIKHRTKFAISHLMMKKYGWMAIFIQKYLYGIKTLIPLVIGVSKYNLKHFIFFNFFASIIWAVSIGLLSYEFSELAIVAAKFIKENPYYAPFIALSFVGLTWIFLKRIESRKRSNKKYNF